MTMSPDQFRDAIDNLNDAEVEEVIAALGRARATAMEYTVRARIPECGEFGGIAQDLDAALSLIKEQFPTEPHAPMSNMLASLAQAAGMPVTNIRMSDVDPVDLRGLPFLPSQQ